MASTLGDEYHGHKCRSAKRLAEMLIFYRNQRPQSAVEKWEDEVTDSLYMVGEITREEWLMAHERMGDTWPAILRKT
jgi:hypothetical protein